MDEITMLFISDFSLPHPATRNHSTGMKPKEELCVSNHKNANTTSMSPKKHAFHTTVELILPKIEEWYLPL